MLALICACFGSSTSRKLNQLRALVSEGGISTETTCLGVVMLGESLSPTPLASFSSSITVCHACLGGADAAANSLEFSGDGLGECVETLGLLDMPLALPPAFDV